MTIGWECDELLNISSHDNWFQICVRLCYHGCLIVFVLAQTLWLHLANRFRTEPPKGMEKFLKWFTFLHVIALNLMIYLKTTLDEASKSFGELGNSEVPNENEIFHSTEATHYILRNGGGGEGGGESAFKNLLMDLF